MAIREDSTCGCGLYIHPTRRNPQAIHCTDCKYCDVVQLAKAMLAGEWKPKGRARFIARRDGDQWRIWDRDQRNWRGKGVKNYADLSGRLDRLNGA